MNMSMITLSLANEKPGDLMLKSDSVCRNQLKASWQTWSRLCLTLGIISTELFLITGLFTDFSKYFLQERKLPNNGQMLTQCCCRCQLQCGSYKDMRLSSTLDHDIRRQNLLFIFEDVCRFSQREFFKRQNT